MLVQTIFGTMDVPALCQLFFLLFSDSVHFLGVLLLLPLLLFNFIFLYL